MLIDTHTHLDFEQFDKDRGAVIKKAKEADVAILNSFVGAAEGVEKSLGLAKQYDVYTTVGLSPTELDGEKVDERIKLIRKHKSDIVGVGEVGLDYYWVKEKEKHRIEQENFKKFILLSDELSLPLVIHSRDTEEDVIMMLRDANKRAILHCFSGTVKQAFNAISFECLISIPTSIIYSKKKQKLVEELPIESMVLETDAPYLSPVPKTRNEPANIKLSAEKIAGIKGVDTSDIEDITTSNAKEFFNI